VSVDGIQISQNMFTWDNKHYPKQPWLMVTFYLCLSATDPCILTFYIT